jgi:stringent starvation protein B
MESAMPPLPPKKAVALDLLERTSVFVHLDPRRAGVVVPPVFLKQPQLVLQIGLNMQIPIVDLEVEDAGISCTLSFSRRPHFCRLPWSAIYALIGQEGGGMVWPEDVPPEVVAQQRSGAASGSSPKKEAPARKPALRALDGGALTGGALDGSALDDGSDIADSADRQEGARDDGPLSQRSPTPFPKADVARKEGPRRTPTPRPQLVSVASASEDDGVVSSKPGELAGSSEPAPAADVGSSTGSESPRPGSNKPSRPPYLRLVR